MRAWAAALVVIAIECGRVAGEAHVVGRDRVQLIEAVHEAATGGPITTAPSEAELAWINDRAISADERLDQASRLYSDTKDVMKRAYVEPGDDGMNSTYRAMQWTAATVTVFARYAELAHVEALTTLEASVPGDAERITRREKLGLAAAGMLMGGLSMLGATQIDDASRRLLVEAWARHIDRYVLLWGPGGCPLPASGMSGALAVATDPAVIVALQRIDHALASCSGPRTKRS